MLYWENEVPALGQVHHLTVLCYHFQHPNLYSPQGLRYAVRLLRDFIEGDVTPQQARVRNRARVDSHRRAWKITAAPASYGGYLNPVHWKLTAADVIASGAENYCAAVQQWAQSIHSDLKTSANL